MPNGQSAWAGLRISDSTFSILRPIPLDSSRSAKRHASDYQRALAFLVICLAMANVALFIGVGGPPISGRDGPVWPVLKLLAVGVLVNLLIVVLVAILLTVA